MATMDDLREATWTCSDCAFLRYVVVFRQMPSTPQMKGLWLKRILDHERTHHHLVYPKRFLPWQDETIVYPTEKLELAQAA